MVKTILFLLSIVPTLIFGQQTKKITDKESNEVYYVLKSDKTTKHGEYKKLNYRNSILLKGFYKNGIKDSIWESYNFEGQITLKYDYSKNELIYFKPNEKLANQKYKLIDGKNNPDTSLSRPPLFLNGNDYIMSELVKNIRYPTEAAENGKSGKVNVLFTVDKFGKTNNYYVDKPLGYGMDEEAIRVLKLNPDNWLPGLLNGQAVDVEVVYPINFQLR